LMRQLKDDGVSVPVIFITSAGNEATRQAALEVGASPTCTSRFRPTR
jgi:DNA-binding response OmpR family regulator